MRRGKNLLGRRNHARKLQEIRDLEVTGSGRGQGRLPVLVDGEVGVFIGFQEADEDFADDTASDWPHLLAVFEYFRLLQNVVPERGALLHAEWSQFSKLCGGGNTRAFITRAMACPEGSPKFTWRIRLQEASDWIPSDGMPGAGPRDPSRCIKGEESLVSISLLGRTCHLQN